MEQCYMEHTFNKLFITTEYLLLQRLYSKSPIKDKIAFLIIYLKPTIYKIFIILIYMDFKIQNVFYKIISMFLQFRLRKK